MIKPIVDNVEKIDKISFKISKLTKTMKHIPEELYPVVFNDYCEKIYSHLVELYSALCIYHRKCSTAFSTSKIFPAQASKHTKILELRDDYIKIKMPLLHRKQERNFFLAKDLEAAFQTIIKDGTSIPYMDKKEISFTFCYSSEVDKKYIRDTDNYETRSIINTIVRNMRCSDSGLTTQLSMKTIIKDEKENHTIIEIIGLNSNTKLL